MNEASYERVSSSQGVSMQVKEAFGKAFKDARKS
jgi:hypothetical protein